MGERLTVLGSLVVSWFLFLIGLGLVLDLLVLGLLLLVLATFVHIFIVGAKIFQVPQLSNHDDALVLDLILVERLAEIGGFNRVVLLLVISVLDEHHRLFLPFRHELLPEVSALLQSALQWIFGINF